ncbi:uncharacterized protein LOC142941649 isoform X3 [Anarhichas minor]|uniref:uncharacterized protein LOC142941649 isoform X3 n=2 Tax=Anarhichas minor TaxID=65739 RepID=UPI003F732C57
MPEVLSTNYQALSDMDQEEITVSGKKFFVHLAGTTNDAHHDFVAKLKGIGKIDVASPEDSDFLVVFCPIVSRVGTDISTALNNTPAGTPVILVVMHHTFNSDYVVAESRRQVTNPNVLLTVDFLFHERNLLTSNRNDIAWHEVETFLGSSRSVIPPRKYMSGNKFFVHLAGKTNDAHRDFVAKLKGIGKIDVAFLEDSDFLVVFCPIVSRVGTDISTALNNIPAGKPVILVMMHHTFNREYVVAESRRQVTNPNVLLTVDFLFHERNLLTSNRNDIAWHEVETFLGSSRSVIPPGKYMSGNKFFVHLAGKTNDAHRDFVAKLKGIGKIDVAFLEDSDFLVVFCPIISRVGTDISTALNNIPAGKPVILVMMHHTFNREYVVAESRRQVTNPNVLLTVDFLFHERNLLTSNRNDIAWHEVETFLGSSRSVIPPGKYMSGNKFFVHLAGKTNDAHRDFVAKLKGIGKIDVAFLEDSDFLVVFCPIISRVGTDISTALNNIPAGKPVILVMMHHTFNREYVVAESRRQVTNPNVLLTVDFLFHERNLLTSNRNDIAWHEVETFLGSSRSVIPPGKYMSGNKFFVHLAGKTNDAHRDFVAKLKGIGKIDVATPEDSDFLVVFCPIVSQVGTDISTALNNTPVGKPVILVVMHHTFNREYIVAESRRQVSNPNVLLTVDLLFHERNLLTSNRNDIAWHEVETFLGSSCSAVPPRKYRYLAAAGVALALIIVIIVEVKKKKV